MECHFIENLCHVLYTPDIKLRFKKYRDIKNQIVTTHLLQG